MQATRGTPLTGEDCAPPGSGRVRLLVGVAVLALALDIATKVVVVDRLEGRPPVQLLGGLLTLLHTRNPGAAFGIGAGATVLFTLIALGVVAFIARTARQVRSSGWALSLGLLLGGASGNLVDRLLRSPGPFRGHVVDWIAVPHWPAFNVADSAIVAGGGLAVLLAMRGIGIDGTRGDAPAGGMAAADDSPSEPAGTRDGDSALGPDRKQEEPRG